jgi:hypothetical protein
MMSKLSIGLLLIIAGILIILLFKFFIILPRPGVKKLLRKALQEDTLDEEKEGTHCQDTDKCPFCNSPNIDEGIYSWQRVCLDCRKEWGIGEKP